MTTAIRTFLARWSAALRAIVGAPDYGRYLAHMRSAHPGDRAMTETEFNVARTGDRYDRVGSRCC